MAEVLDDQSIEAGVARLDGWRREGDAIVRDLELPGFGAAIAFVAPVAARARAGIG
jgi:pterin-4a-carbinolamine dehydratase